MPKKGLISNIEGGGTRGTISLSGNYASEPSGWLHTVLPVAAAAVFRVMFSQPDYASSPETMSAPVIEAPELSGQPGEIHEPDPAVLPEDPTIAR